MCAEAAWYRRLEDDEKANSTFKTIVSFIYSYVLVAQLFVRLIWCPLSTQGRRPSRTHLAAPALLLIRSELSEASQQVLHEVLSPILDLHVK
jgi:hypothetical protein